MLCFSSLATFYQLKNYLASYDRMVMNGRVENLRRRKQWPALGWRHTCLEVEMCSFNDAVNYFVANTLW